MEPIDEVKWDLAITGTNLAESLLALSLSRSEKRILHLDRNGYYGGAEAALSLQDAEDWTKDVANGATPSFHHARITVPDRSNVDSAHRLATPRAYNLALAPHIIYAKSSLIPLLVSSKVYRQLEFLAVGSWWVYDASLATKGSDCETIQSLHRIPNRREDIFRDESLDLRTKRSLIKFLRLVMDPAAQAMALEEWGGIDLQSYLDSQFAIPLPLQAGLHALTLLPQPASQTLLSHALPRIARHLGSFGVFGSSFSAVIPKWGGLAEIAQVGCRALAVGGGVYMLGTNVRERHPFLRKPMDEHVMLHLDSGECVSAALVAASQLNSTEETRLARCTRSITIVSSELAHVFSSSRESSPKPAVAIVVFPVGSLNGSGSAEFPVYLMIHTAETGECPEGQSIIYATIGTAVESAPLVLSHAVDQFLNSVGERPEVCVCWRLEYQQSGLSPLPPEKQTADVSSDASECTMEQPNIILPPPSLDLAFDDRCLDHVRAAWHVITEEKEGFMDFEDREKDAYDSDGAES